jgi:hypothetical protein
LKYKLKIIKKKEIKSIKLKKNSKLKNKERD